MTCLWQRCKATQSRGCLRSTSLTFVGCRSRFSTRRRREESLHAQTRRAQNRPDPHPVNAKISAPLGSAEGSEIVNQWSLRVESPASRNALVPVDYPPSCDEKHQVELLRRFQGRGWSVEVKARSPVAWPTVPAMSSPRMSAGLR